MIRTEIEAELTEFWLGPRASRRQRQAVCLIMNAGLDQPFDELLAQALDGTTPQTRLLEIIDEFNRYVAANEKLFRTAQRHYFDTWLAAERAGPGVPHRVREGRRLRWISTVLAPLGDTMPDTDLQRLQAALCLVTGGEGYSVLRDICQLEPDEAIAVANWAAQALLTAAIQNTAPR